MLRIDAPRRPWSPGLIAATTAVVAIPMTHYSHPGGIYDSSGSVTTPNINVDTVVLAVAAESAQSTSARDALLDAADRLRAQPDLEREAAGRGR